MSVATTIRVIKRKTNPLPSINKKTPRENDAFNMKDKKPRKKKKAKDRLRSNLRLKTTSVAWLNLYVPEKTKTAIQAITMPPKIFLYSNWLIAGVVIVPATASGNRFAYATIAASPIAIESGTNIKAIMEI